ncbi:MAG: DUF433 domain-containing protein [Terricaulis sp.]
MAHTRITRDPKIMMGKPCVAGTRVTVEAILEDLSDGMSAVQVAEAYDGLTDEDVRAALDYAAEYLRQESVIAAE